VHRGVVACTGIEFCNLAVTETKQRAKNIVNLLEEGVKWNESEFFRINVNGCPNSCGQHWIADVGLQGCTKKVDGELKSTSMCSWVARWAITKAARHVSIAASSASWPRSRADDSACHQPLSVNRQGTESFADYVARHSDEELAEII
jgi:sulfite reductase beta subunit-like hemoprotein